MNNKFYIIFMILVIVLALSSCKKKQIQEDFYIFGSLFESPTIWEKAANIIGDLASLSSRAHLIVTDFPRLIKEVGEVAIDVLLFPAKTMIGEFEKGVKRTQRDFHKIFSVLKDIFAKLKYLSQLLLFMINRAKICSEGADKVIKNYTIKTKEVMTKLSEITNKMEICIKNPFDDFIGYCKGCVFQIVPFIQYSYEYGDILIQFYKEVLTYPELFPQGSTKSYCQNNAKKIRSQSDAIKYAHKCNTCFHIKSVLSLGLKELQEFFKIIKVLFDNSKKFEKAINKIAGLLKIKI